MKKTKGFTLIELMVVIVILGILAAVIAPRIPGFVNKAKEGKTKGNLGNLRSALNIYYSDKDGVYPSSAAATLSTVLCPKYIKEIPAAEMPPFHTANSNVIAMSALGDAGGYAYEERSAQNGWGDIVVNCNAHTDSSGAAWSSF